MTSFRRPSMRGSPPGCLALFFAVFAVAGLFFLGAFVKQARRDYRAVTAYQATTCTILDKRVVEKRDSDGSTYRPELDFEHVHSGRTYHVRGYDGWTISSSGYKSKRAIIDQFVIGQTYPCWFDPNDPEQAVLKRGNRWAYLVGFLPLIFVCVGLGGIGWVIMSPRRKPRVGEEDVWLPPPRAKEIRPNVVQLRPSATARASALGILLFATFWNGVTWTIVLMMHDQDTHVPLFAKAILGLFAVLGLFIIYGAFKSIAVAVGVGETLVEMEPAALRPGESFAVRVRQKRVPLERLAISLRCSEKASYTVGTDTRTETALTLDEPLSPASNGSPLESATQVVATGRIPPNAMHSFKSPKNEIEWAIVVKLSDSGLFNFERIFPIRVLPHLRTGRNEVDA